MLNFQKLDVYKRSLEFLALSVQLSSQVPKGNADLVDQIKRAATSIPLNIAEASGRNGKDAAHHFAIARGSAMECAAALDTLKVLRAVDAASHQRGSELLSGLVSMLTKLCR